MPLLTEHVVRARARMRARGRHKTVASALSEEARRDVARYDVFLSQTIHDAEIVYGVYASLTDMGLTVFCDWMDNLTDRSQVTPANADYIRERMRVSDSLLFLDTEKADQSKWMCWELGWFDGENGHVAVLPVVSDASKGYRGREFLGLYPVAEVGQDGRLHIQRPPTSLGRGLTMFQAPSSKPFLEWKLGANLLRPRA